MTIMPFQPRHSPQPAGELVARDTVDGWLEMLRPVADLAAEIAHTEFVPAGLRGKPAAITAAILYGREIGLGPLQSLQSVDVIEGRPAIGAEMARALALSQGHEIYIEESTTTRCVIRGRRRNSREWVTITWNIDDAKRAKLDGRTNWQRHPRRMLQARATSELCHLLFADAIGGMPFTLDELADDSDAAGQVATADTPAAAVAEPAKRTAQRRTRAAAPPQPPAAATPPPAAAGEPPLPGEPGYNEHSPVAGPPAAEPVTPDQLTKLHTVYSTHGVEDRDERLDIASRIVGRRLATSKELTKDEARALIDTLERAAHHQAGFTGFLDELLKATADEPPAEPAP